MFLSHIVYTVELILFKHLKACLINFLEQSTNHFVSMDKSLSAPKFQSTFPMGLIHFPFNVRTLRCMQRNRLSFKPSHERINSFCILMSALQYIFLCSFVSVLKTAGFPCQGSSLLKYVQFSLSAISQPSHIAIKNGDVLLLLAVAILFAQPRLCLCTI